MQREDPCPSVVDGAQHAGLSQASVPRAPNNSTALSQGVQECVPALVGAPGAGAGPSASQQTGALFISDILNPQVPEIVGGGQDGAGPDNTASGMRDSAEAHLWEQKALATLANPSVDSIIVWASRPATRRNPDFQYKVSQFSVISD